MTTLSGTQIVIPPPRRRWPRGLAWLAAIVVAAGLAAGGICHFRAERKFANPIAFTMVGGRLYVLEKARNTVLDLAIVTADGRMELRGKYPIEPDDEQYYYMVRKLFPAPTGMVAQSFIYDQQNHQFLGYRFRQYERLDAPPRELLTVFLPEPEKVPEINYACDTNGWHYFGNNCEGFRCIWKVPPAGGLTVRGAQLPPGLIQLGETNTAFTSWAFINVDAQGRIYLSSAASERILVHSPTGEKLREIGRVGFAPGQLLAPDELSFIPLSKTIPAGLAVASTGNRSWVLYDMDGEHYETYTPLTIGYPFPDVLVGPVFIHQGTGRIISFDLVNKALVLLGRPITAVATYQTCRHGLTILLIALAVALLLLVALHPWLARGWRRVRVPFFIKLLLLFIPLLTGSAYVVGDWVRDDMMQDLINEYLRRSANLSLAVINSLSVEDLQAIRKPEDRGSAAYERIYNTVTRIIDRREVENTPKWIIHKIYKRNFYFGISIWRGPIFEPYIVPYDRTMFFAVLRDKQPQWGRFTDEQGEWFSYLRPIMDEKGQVIYVLELYRSTEDMDRAERKVMRKVGLAIGATALAATLLVLIFSYLTTRPLRRLIAGTAVVSTGNFDQPIIVRTRDELGDLAGAFNRMMVALKQYTGELARTTAENERIQAELQFAREVQQGIVPRNFPPHERMEHVEIVAEIVPAREVGGDYYDFFPVDADHVGVVIADVSGKGLPAGLFMMLVRTLLRDNAAHNLSAGDAVARMNALAVRDNPSGMFVTLFYMICDMRTGRVVYTNAGHNLPILLKRDGPAMLEPAEGHGRGMVVGIMDNARYTDGEFTLAPGESILLYTDGVTEAFSADDRMFGDEGLLEVAVRTEGQAAADRCRILVEEVLQFQKGREQSDDITVLFFKYLGMGDKVSGNS